MKVVLFAVLAVLSVLGLVSCQYNYGYNPYQTGGNSNMLTYGALLFVFLLFFLFNQKKSVPVYFQNRSLGINVQTGVIG